MPFGITYGSREAALAEAIADALIARGVIGGGTGGADNSDVVAVIQNLVQQQGDALSIRATVPLPDGAATNATLVEVRDRLSSPIPYSSYLNLGSSVGFVVKNTSGKLFGFSIHNKSNGTIWINFFDKSILPTSVDTCIETHPVFAGGYLNIDSVYLGAAGMPFSSGIAVTLSLTAGDSSPYTGLINNTVWAIKYL